MAWTDQRQGVILPKRAASDIPAFAIVAEDPGQENQVVKCGSGGQRPYGSVDQGTIVRADYGAVYSDFNVVKAVAAASIGAGAEVAVVGATTSLGLAVAASGVAGWSVGRAQTNAAAGERFSVLIKPRQLAGLA